MHTFLTFKRDKRTQAKMVKLSPPTFYVKIFWNFCSFIWNMQKPPFFAIIYRKNYCRGFFQINSFFSKLAHTNTNNELGYFFGFRPLRVWVSLILDKLTELITQKLLYLKNQLYAIMLNLTVFWYTVNIYLSYPVQTLSKFWNLTQE